MRRRKKKKLLILLAGVLLAVLLFLGAFSILRIDTVEVSGNERYTGQQIEEYLFNTKLSRNPIYCYYSYRFRPHKSIPFVEDYRIVFKSPTRVEVIIYEKSVVGYVSYMSSYMYFDKDGIIVESTGEMLPGVPMVTGLSFGHIVLHRPLPVSDPEVFEELLNLTQILSVYELSVDKIYFGSDKTMRLYLGELQVELGDNSQMNGKISNLRDIVRDYPQLSGTLYLDSYDESNSNPMYRIEQK